MKKSIITAGIAVAVATIGIAQSYNMVVTTKDGKTHKFESTQIERVLFDEEAGTSLNTLVNAIYATSGDNGIYTVTIGNAAADVSGNPDAVGDVQLTLAFVAPKSDDARNAILSAGTYTPGNGSEQGTYDVQHSALYIRTSTGADGVAMKPLIAGNVEVSQFTGPGSEYSLKGEVTTLEGEVLNFYYNGPIAFNPSLGASSPFDTDLNVTFTGGQMRFYGNWFDTFSDDATVQLYSGTFDENGKQIEGYWMNIDLYMPKVIDPWSNSITIADGVYYPEWREKVPNYSYLPYTYVKGQIQDVFGTEYPTNTYITHQTNINGSTVTNLGLLGDGTITVSENGTKIVIDMVMDNGNRMMGTYNGNILLGNFHDADAPQMEMLDNNVELSFPENSVAISASEGNTIIENLNTYLVMIADMNMSQGDYISFSLLTDGERLKDGTYHIGELTNFGGIPGTLDYGGQVLYSWYGDLSAVDEDGYNTIMAPLKSGTVKITTISEYVKTFEIDVVTQKGKTIKGTYTGDYMDYADLEDLSAKSKKIKLRK